jgi:hypothetical protein
VADPSLLPGLSSRSSSQTNSELSSIDSVWRMPPSYPTLFVPTPSPFRHQS